MRRGCILLFLVPALVAPFALRAASDPEDKPGSKDPGLFSRMPGFHIYSYEELEFDRFEFPVASGKTQAVEGRRVSVHYYANDGIRLPSAIQVTRNYTNAVKAIGGKVVYEYEDGGRNYTTFQVAKGNVESWAFVEGSGNGMYSVTVVEKEAMRQDVVANAAAMAGSIRDTGKVALYGITFDTDRADVRPESDATIAEIAKLLKNDARLSVYVVGHTDNSGAFDHNVKLSQARAASVVKVLTTKHGIAAARLAPFGAGPVSPVASNATAEGRARNRRVEIVAQ
ncbi:MAG: OmpA family protein [Thermoanaerobaculia bacterium]